VARHSRIISAGNVNKGEYYALLINLLARGIPRSKGRCALQKGGTEYPGGTYLGSSVDHLTVHALTSIS